MLKLDPGFTKPKIILKRIRYPRKKVNQSVSQVKMLSLTFEKLVLISFINGVISIEQNVDLTTVSFGIKCIKTNIHNDNSPKICFILT